jgi:hypothetical protein
MNLKGSGRKWSWANFRYYPDFCQEELRKTTTSVKVVGVLAEIRIGHLPNTNQEGVSPEPACLVVLTNFRSFPQDEVTTLYNSFLNKITQPFEVSTCVTLGVLPFVSSRLFFSWLRNSVDICSGHVLYSP